MQNGAGMFITFDKTDGVGCAATGLEGPGAAEGKRDMGAEMHTGNLGGFAASATRDVASFGSKNRRGGGSVQ